MTTISKCWVLRLQRYNYKVRCVKSHDNIADALSRLTNIPVSRKFCYDNEYVSIVALESVPVALKIQEIESQLKMRSCKLCVVALSVGTGRGLESHIMSS